VRRFCSLAPRERVPARPPCHGAACDSCMDVYGGTSCAAPAAAGTAALLRDYFINSGLPSGPGNIYAGMIAFGTESPNDTNGSGKTNLAGPLCSRFSVGQVTVANGEVRYVPVNIGAGEFGSNLKAGIWWPTEPGAHRDVDLRVESPSGSVVAWSQGVPSVFERAQVTGTLQNGTWWIRIKGYNIPSGSQTVYYVIHNKIC
jgi:serine protease AprX